MDERTASSISKLPKKPFNPSLLYIILWLVSLWWITIDLDISFQTLVYGFQDIAEYFSRYSRPDFTEFPKFFELMKQTLAIALWGTFLAVVLGMLLAPLAAANLSPSRWAYKLARETLNFLRAMPDLLLALIFVASLGLGALPGVLAIGLHTAGFLGKFFAENFERVDKGVIEAIEATGAARLQVLMYAAWPSTLREAVGYTLYILDRNVRVASILGMVGAGGIGLALNEALKLFRYGEAAALILFILVVILLFDYISIWLRRKLS